MPTEIARMLEMVETALAASGIDSLARDTLSGLVEKTTAETACLYLGGTSPPDPRCYHYGADHQTAMRMEALCEAAFTRLETKSSKNVITKDGLWLAPLEKDGSRLGILSLMFPGIVPPEDAAVWSRFAGMFSEVLFLHLEREQATRQINSQNAYMTVSSMLSQSLDLKMLLEGALYCCMDMVSAEAGSVMLLNQEKTSLSFYSVQGQAKLILMQANFPADQGVAGDILKSRQSEVINDVQADPRFYKEIDSESGFRTRNMIALPLVADDENVGVLELLNKMNGADFTEEDRLNLELIAEEVAFAIQNAIIFEFVADSYCLIRQGKTSCDGCKRPLGNWTPCVRFREVAVFPEKSSDS